MREAVIDKAEGKPLRLSRNRIVETGLLVVRRDGLDALTMRLVASEVGSGTMSLYRHVSDRNDLLAGMLDHVAVSLQHPPLNADPVEELVQVFTTIYRSFRQDPWIVRYLIAGNIGSQHILPLVERIMLALRQIGVNGSDALHHYFLLLHYTYGEVLVMDAADRRPSPSEHQSHSFAQSYPTLAKCLEEASRSSSDEDLYEGNVRRMLENLHR